MKSSMTADRDCERREGEVAELDLVVGHGGDDGRGAGIAHRLDQVGLAVMLQEVGLLRQQRRPVGRRNDPAGADLQRLGAVGEPGCRHQGGEAEQHHSQPAHGFLLEAAARFGPGPLGTTMP
jgi:hypothetical protein